MNSRTNSPSCRSAWSHWNGPCFSKHIWLDSRSFRGLALGSSQRWNQYQNNMHQPPKLVNQGTFNTADRPKHPMMTWSKCLILCHYQTCWSSTSSWMDCAMVYGLITPEDHQTIDTVGHNPACSNLLEETSHDSQSRVHASEWDHHPPDDLLCRIARSLFCLEGWVRWKTRGYSDIGGDEAVEERF